MQRRQKQGEDMKKTKRGSYLEVTIRSKTQAVAGATKVFTHRGNKTHLPCIARNLPCLLDGEKEREGESGNPVVIQNG